MAQNTVSVTSPALQEATKSSTIVWRQDLEALFHHAKDRFPDVVWEVGEGDDIGQELWGHKAVVYARAPPSFQARYFSFRPNPYTSSPPPTASSSSLDLSSSRTPSPNFPAPSVAPTNTLLRISTSINPTLFSKELEYLYTGQGFGEAFEFLYDSSESTPNEADAEELRIDKLRKDLVFMWRSRLYSDVRISLTGTFSSSNHENTTAIFSSHRFILVSRCPYFHTALLSWPKQQDQQMLTLPSPPFTPASLHFTLGFIYTGTLIFSHRSYDLDTAFHIMRSSTYLSLPTLYDEIQARIIQEMMHGLFHAFLPFPEYERLTAGAWGTGGCRCRQCARRAPRVLEFSLTDDVKNSLLERGARRALVGLFGEGWCTSEFAALPPKLRDGLLKGLGKRTTPQNAFALLSAAEHALARLGAVIDAWAGDVRDMILAARKTIDECVCSQPEACFATSDWNDIMERDGVAFEDAERVEWIMASVSRGVNERNAAPLYQTLVSSILLRPHPTETDAPILSPTSHVRVQVEQARVDLLKWIGKRWLGIRQEGGFDQLEGWALKEISDNLEVPREDLINPRMSASQPHKPPRQSTLVRAKESASNNDSISLHSSMRVSVRSRNLPMTSAPGRASSSTGTSYKTSRMNDSTTSLAHSSPLAANGVEKDQATNKDNSRPDSKLTPALDSIGLPPYSSPTASPRLQPSVLEPDGSQNGDYDNQSITESISGDDPYPATLSLDHNRLPPLPPKKMVIKKVTPMPRQPSATAKSRTPASPTRPTSSPSVRSSAASVRSVASTIRKSNVTDTSKSVKPSITSRPTSHVSLASTSPTISSRPSSRPSSQASSSFRTASSSAPRSRQTSTTSTVSTATRARDTTTSSRGPLKTPLRSRTTSASSSKSNVSSVSVRSAVSSVAGTPQKKRPPVPPVDPSKLSPNVMMRTRTISSTSSVRSTTSTVSTAASTAARKAMTNATRKVGNGNGTALSPAEQVKEMARARDKEITKASNQATRTSSSASASVTAIVTASSAPEPVTGEPTAAEPELQTTSSGITIKPQSKADLSLEHKKSDSVASTGSNSTLKRRNSSDTITTRLSVVVTNTTPNHHSSRAAAPTSISEAKALKENQPLPTLPIAARGASLDIGIPCIISLKRKRFKAYARYIGEVEGEDGPWVGVEVPVNDSWGAAADRDDGERQWNDGTWGGIRYFDIGSATGSEWDYSGDDRAARRRRADWAGGSWGSNMFGTGKSVLKREGDQLSLDHRSKRFRSISPAMSDASGMESRGLFVRPQQVLYVVDALGADV